MSYLTLLAIHTDVNERYCTTTSFEIFIKLFDCLHCDLSIVSSSILMKWALSICLQQ